MSQSSTLVTMLQRFMKNKFISVNSKQKCYKIQKQSSTCQPKEFRSINNFIHSFISFNNTIFKNLVHKTTEHDNSCRVKFFSVFGGIQKDLFKVTTDAMNTNTRSSDSEKMYLYMSSPDKYFEIWYLFHFIRNCLFSGSNDFEILKNPQSSLN